jgi:iron complex outermembrane receptor protein
MKSMAIPTTRSLPVFLLAALLIISTAVQGVAADQSGEKQPSQVKAAKIDRMVVTAQKRQESYLDVPLSISAFSSEQLSDAGINDTMDLIKQVPNVYLKQAEPENTVIIRGITSFHSSIYAPSGFYVDDVNFPLQYMHNTELYDVERVEVLKGPQGTLYGRNTESGVINVITKQPGNELTGKLTGEYGNFNTIRLGFNAAGPIVENKLFLGIAALKKDLDGYYTNIHDDDDRISKIDHLNCRANLRWTPSDPWDISLIADMIDHNDGYGLYRFLNGPNKTKRHEVNIDYPENHINQDGNGQTLKVKYKGSFFDFLSVTSNRYYKRELKGDRDGTPLPQGYTNFSWEDKQKSQEFRLASNTKKTNWEWLCGLYGFKEDVNTVNNMQSLIMGPLWDNRTGIDITGYAAFSQVTYTMWDKLHLTAGLRWDHNDLEGNLKGSQSYLTPLGQNIKDDLSFNELLPKIAVSLDCAEDILCYATVAKGYLIGGFNYVSAYSQQAFTYDPEYTWNYEVGIKSSWLDDRLHLTASLFYIDIKDKQVFEIDQNVPIPGAQNIRNAAKAHSAGGEIGLHALPVRGLELFAGFALTEAKIDEWTAKEVNGTTYNYEGKHLTYYPKTTLNLGLQYRHACGLFSRIDYINTGEIYCDSKNLIKQDAYQEVNLRLGYETELFDVTLWAKNLFDEEYFSYMTHYGPSTLVVDGAPRTIGVTLSYKF